MRVQLTAARHTEGKPGQSVENQQLGKHFSVTGDGKVYFSPYTVFLNTVLVATQYYQDCL
jgi:hypothetical protein